jgi:hypothetical protein
MSQSEWDIAQEDGTSAGGPYGHARTARAAAIELSDASNVVILVRRGGKVAYAMNPGGRAEAPAGAITDPRTNCVRHTGVVCWCVPCREARRANREGEATLDGGIE